MITGWNQGTKKLQSKNQDEILELQQEVYHIKFEKIVGNLQPKLNSNILINCMLNFNTYSSGNCFINLR